MKQILFATKNKDKFRLYNSVLSEIDTGIELVSAVDKGIIVNIQELGDELTRSKQKIDLYMEKFDPAKYLGVLAVDVGIVIPGANVDTPEIKKTIDDMLKGRVINPGQIFSYKVGATIYNCQHSKYVSTQFENPYVFQGLPEGMEVSENTSLIQFTNSFVGEERRSSDLTDREITDNVLKYAAPHLSLMLEEAGLA